MYGCFPPHAQAETVIELLSTTERKFSPVILFMCLQGGTSQASREAPGPRSHACRNGPHPYCHPDSGSGSTCAVEAATL